MNDYEKTLLHLRTEDSIAEIEQELNKLLAVRDRFSDFATGDEDQRYLLDRAFAGATQGIFSRIELFLVEVVANVDHAVLDGRSLLQTAALATPCRPAIISTETRRLLETLIPIASLAREGSFWPEALKLAERSVRNLRSEFDAFAKGHAEVRP